MRALIVALAVAGCYEPTVESCAIGCDLEGGISCPGDLICGSDFHCHAPGDEETCTFAVEVDFQNPGALDGQVIGEGLACPGDCATEVLGGAELLVQAKPGTDPVFVEFAGCLGDGRNSCTTRVVRPTVIDARLSPGRVIRVDFRGDGFGRIVSTPSGIDCRGPADPKCEAVFGVDEEVTLRATPDEPTHFLGFVAACAAGSTECVIPPSSDPVEVGAVFDVLRLSILAASQGQGDDLIHIEQVEPIEETLPPCSSGTCLLLFDPDQRPTLKLEAVPGTDQRFREWFGVAGCARSESCTITSMDRDTIAVAAFDALKLISVNVKRGQLTVRGEDSSFLCPPQVPGSAVCSSVFRLGEQVTVAPTSGAARFLDWSSNPTTCPDDPQVPCTFAVVTDTLIGGTFRDPQIKLGTVPGDGVSRIDILVDGDPQPSCGPFNDGIAHECSFTFPVHSTVSMKALTGNWVTCGATPGGPTCELLLDDDAIATASF